MMTRFLSGLMAGLILAGSVAVAGEWYERGWSVPRSDRWIERERLIEERRHNREVEQFLTDQRLRDLANPC